MSEDGQGQPPDETLADLKRHAGDLKRRIEEQRKKSAMPVNSALGSPAIDADNADGHNDVKDDEDD